MAIIGLSGKKNSGKDLCGAIIQALTNKPGTFDKLDTVTEKDVMYKVWGMSTYKNIKFADKLKDIICLLLGCTREKLEEREYKESPLPEEWWYYKIAGKLYTRWYCKDASDNRMCEEKYLVKTTPRLLLQLMGTECGRQILHPNLWLNAVMSGYKASAPNGKSGDDSKYPNWVITDVRFPNELEAIQNKGITIRVNRTKQSEHATFYGTQEKLEEEFVARIKAANDSMKHTSETSLDNAVFDHTIENNGSIKDLIKKIKEILIIEKLI